MTLSVEPLAVFPVARAEPLDEAASSAVDPVAPVPSGALAADEGERLLHGPGTVPEPPASCMRRSDPCRPEITDPFAENDDPFRSLPPEARAELLDLNQLALAYEADAAAPNTRKVYTRRWKHFLRWCALRHVQPLPAHPDAIVVYVASLVRARLSVSTIEVTFSAIKRAHRARNLPVPASPRLHDLLHRVRLAGGQHLRRPQAVTIEQMRQIVVFGGAVEGAELDLNPADPLAVRDRAIVLVTYFGGLRRSEAAALEIPWVTREADGFVLRLAQSTDDQEDEGDYVGLEFQAPDLCPVRALDRWLLQRARYADPTRGAVFLSAKKAGCGFGRCRAMSGDDIYRVIRKRALAAGFPAGLIKPDGLRSGVLIEAARHGASLEAIARHARHTSREQTLAAMRPATVLGVGSATRGLT